MDVDNLAAYIEQLERVPYVKRVRLEDGKGRVDGILRVQTGAGEFALTIEVKRSYLDRAVANALLARAAHKAQVSVIVFTRYMPRPIGERLAAAGINFVDHVGNLHLRLGDNQTLLLGKKEGRPISEAKRTGPAAIQVYCTFLAAPETIQWPARRIAEVSGAGKTAAAEARQRLVSDGILQPLKNDGFSMANRKALEDHFIRGYEHILRPHISLGRYTSAHRDPAEFVDRAGTVLSKQNLKWALTGAAGAYELERFYQSDETQIFVGVHAMQEDLKKNLQLLPDKFGPITLFKLFGPIVLYPEARKRPVANPWLIYAELLYQGDARALEAAEEIRDKFLK